MTLGPIEATIERGWREAAAIDEAFARGEIDQAEWHARMAALIVPKYLAGDNPRAQSGYTGSEEDWRQARGMVAEAISHSGTFLDVGCACGLLMESVTAWCAERGLVIEPYGVDIAPELAGLARARLPHWADRIFEANAASWNPGLRFDVVRTGHDYVPRSKRAEMITHLVSKLLRPGGRLLVGPYTEERDETRSGPSLEQDLATAGITFSGRLERPHPRDHRVIRRLIYLEVT
jgi:hypothetical protein